MKLSELKNKEQGTITKVNGTGAFRKRLVEMGFVKGKNVKVIKSAPFQDPIEYKILDYKVSLRKSEANLIEVTTNNGLQLNTSDSEYYGIIRKDSENRHIPIKNNEINVALIGNPNCGKTTLFNYASNSKEKVGNYSGVTVDIHEASFKQDGYKFNITDLPGTYSLTAYTPEELYIRNYLIENKPDVVINIVDATNLERNLYLTTQLIDMNIEVVLAMNMYDEVESNNIDLNIDKLSDLLGIPIVPTIGSKGKGIKELFSNVIAVSKEQNQTSKSVQINYGDLIEDSINTVQNVIEKEYPEISQKLSTRYLAIKLIQKDKEIEKYLSESHNTKDIINEVKQQIKGLESDLRDESETIITNQKYNFISAVLGKTYSLKPNNKPKVSDLLDNIFTHKIWGFPFFMLFMWAMFQATFTIGKFPMDWIENAVGMLGGFISINMVDGPLKDLLIDGIIGGVGGVIVFLPNILILFFFISLMEDTGYIARAAFIMDKLMQAIGLQGKSFIPLVMGFGCNVPAVMATRTLESRNHRMLTMLIGPFMSCSARFPVYILIISAFFPESPTLVLFSIYMIGIFLAVFIALLFKKSFFQAEDTPFIMELPPYRIPTLKTLLIHMWNKGSQYLKKMGGFIMIASILIWALSYFPREIEYTKDYDTLISSTNAKYDQLIYENSEDTNMVKQLEEKKSNEIKDYEISKESERLNGSFIGKIGHFIEPVIRPLGFDWKMGVSLVTGIAAKEIVVSSMGVIFQAEADADETSTSLIQKLQDYSYKSGPKKGEKVFTPLVAFGFMLFILIYFPCVAVIAAVKKESDSWKWAVFTMTYTTVLAWLVSFLVFQIGSLFI